MKCNKIRDLLSSYLENELPSEKKSLVRDHLNSCRKCSSLFVSLKEAKTSLSSFSEVDISNDLTHRLYAIPLETTLKIKPRSRYFDFLFRPSLQPVFAALSIIMILFSLYTIYPDRAGINRIVNRQLHIGYNKIDKIFAEAESFTSSLGEHKDNILYSLKNKNPFGGEKGK